MIICLGNPFPIIHVEGMFSYSEHHPALGTLSSAHDAAPCWKLFWSQNWELYWEAGLVRLVTCNLIWQCFRWISFHCCLTWFLQHGELSPFYSWGAETCTQIKMPTDVCHQARSICGKCVCNSLMQKRCNWEKQIFVGMAGEISMRESFPFSCWLGSWAKIKWSI